MFVAVVLLCSVRASAGSAHQIGPDLYAYISENDSSANSTFLVSAQGILVVDTGVNEQEGRKLLDEIRKSFLRSCTLDCEYALPS